MIWLSVAAAPMVEAGRGRAAEPPAAAALSLDQAVAQAERRTGGRVLSAQPVRSQGKLLYRIKVLTPAGSVRVLLMDAERGAWLR